MVSPRRERSAPARGGAVGERTPVDRTGHVLCNDDPALRRAWHPVARVDAVGEAPSKVWLLGEPIVLLRLEGAIVAFPDACPHRRAPLSAGSVVETQLRCAYHGWQFDRSGECRSVPSLGVARGIPPRAHLVPLAVCERFGLVFVALEDPVVPLPEWTEPSGARHVALEPYAGAFGAALLIDNQLDIAHFPFLHAATFGAPTATAVPAYAVERDGWGFTVRTDVEITAANDPGAALGIRPLIQHRTMTYRYLAPFHLELVLAYSEMGGSTTIRFFAQPEDAGHSRLYVDLFFARDEPFTEEEIADRVAFERAVIAEDLALQERFDTTALPLGPGAECHVRADRASVEYRRILADLVGVAS